MLPDDIYHSDLLVHRDGKLSRHPAGRFLIHNGMLHHLEDNYGLQAQTIPEGAVDDYTVQRVNNPGPHLSVASHSDISKGLRHDFIKEHPLPVAMPKPQASAAGGAMSHIEVKPPSVWHYTRVGHDQPHVLEAKEGKYLLDGNPLADDEVSTILDNVRNRTAKLRYPKSGLQQQVQKMEAVFSDLRKADDMDPEAALQHLSGLGAADDKTNAAIAALRRHVFTDPMTGLGNKYAYGQWSKQPRGGVHLALDANNFKGVNDLYGHGAGDEAIKAFGGAIRESLNEVAPPGEQGGSGHRIGGDEFQVHLPSHEHATQFARTLRSKLEAIPAVGGTHRLSMSIGAGADPHTADQALYEAKKQKVISPGVVHQPHTIPHVLFHSAVPGHEGPMTHAPAQPPVLPPAPVAAAPATLAPAAVPEKPKAA
jgi:diguanylate cyclase (GGDEF)-like protein